MLNDGRSVGRSVTKCVRLMKSTPTWPTYDTLENLTRKRLRSTWTLHPLLGGDVTEHSVGLGSCGGVRSSGRAGCSERHNDYNLSILFPFFRRRRLFRFSRCLRRRRINSNSCQSINSNVAFLQCQETVGERKRLYSTSSEAHAFNISPNIKAVDQLEWSPVQSRSIECSVCSKVTL